jgi:hypothetical protein
MLAYRTTWIVKPRCMGKALEFHEERVERIMALGISGFVEARVYTPKFSPNVLVFEGVWESAEANDKFWAESSSDFSKIWDWDAWFELVENNAGTEVWNMSKWDRP